MSNIETQLRRIKNETLDEIRDLELSIERCNQNISRLRTNKQIFNPRVLIERNESELEEFKKRLDLAHIKIDQIENGIYEDELKKEFEENRRIIEHKATATKKKKEDSRFFDTPAQTQAKKKNFKPVYEKNFERDFNYTEKQYFKDVATIPDNLLEKLKNMPNNKGYIWRNIWCFGEKPVSHINEYTLYEKQNQKYLVHVYDLRTRTYSLYDKDNTGKQHLMNRKKF
jgi:ribosomal protein S17E